MFIIIALGNPGEKYETTRHNAGWIVVDELLGNPEWEFNKFANAEMFSTDIEGRDILFVKPQTFMNNSGEVLAYLKKEYDLTGDQLLVVQDDIDLPLGTFKLSFDRGDGGHNGIKSIAAHLGSNAFHRLRLGLSKDIGEGKVEKPDVLAKFTDEEIATLVGLKKEISKTVSRLISSSAK